MLRVLTLWLAIAATAVLADDIDLEGASASAAALQADTQSVIRDADTVDVTGTLPSFDEAIRRSATLPAGTLPTLSAELTDPETLSTIAELMDNATELAAGLGLPADGRSRPSVYVFASFSMPRASLRSLIAQGELAGVPVVLRGLVNNSIEDTMQAVLALYTEGERQQSGAVIDPTLFARFDVRQVPTVVVAESPARACSVEACPTPAHVKIAGDVPLRYSLDRIA
ncbi:MAG: type-F conjugative transfer system pilin assembly protein TrbC, partial [Woeseia sp.]